VSSLRARVTFKPRRCIVAAHQLTAARSPRRGGCGSWGRGRGRGRGRDSEPAPPEQEHRSRDVHVQGAGNPQREVGLVAVWSGLTHPIICLPATHPLER